MFHMSSPAQTRSQNPRFGSQRMSVRFGKTEEATTSQGKNVATAQEEALKAKDAQKDKFASMADSLKEAMPKYQYTIGQDLVRNYDFKLTSKRAQGQANHLLNTVSGSDLAKFAQNGKLGLIEESSDMFFEMYTLKALYNGLVTSKQVKEWAKKMPRVPQGADSSYEVTKEAEPDWINGTHFQKIREQIRTEIKQDAEKNHPKALGRFREMVNKGWDAKIKGEAQDRALDMLSLIGMKCALMTKKDPNYSLFWDNWKFLYGEGEELREEMDGKSRMDRPKKWLVAGLSMLYTLPLMPSGLFRNQITNIVQEELGNGFKVDYKDLMETVYSKQIGRQELDFSRPDIDNKLKADSLITVNKDAMKKGNAKRKCILKPYELWQESAVLKNAKVDNSDRKPTEEVLNTGA